jgi:hypothetical protein
VTRRRDVPTLAFTVPEAAEAIRLSENTLRIWIKEGIVRVVRWQSLDLVPRVELDRLIAVALENGGTLPAVAMTATPSPSAGVEGVAAIGAARPVRGSAGQGRPINGRMRAVGAARIQDNAG